MKANKYIKSIAGLFIVASAMLFSCSGDMSIINQFDPSEERPTIVYENIRTTYTEKGKTQIKVQAKTAMLFNEVTEPYTECPDGVIIVMYNEEDKIETSLSANKGIYYNKIQKWEAIGNVVITNIDGNVMRTEKLYGDMAEDKIYTNEFVQITKADGTLINSKEGFESNTEFTIYQFINVDGKIYFRNDLTEEKSDSTNMPLNPIEKEKPKKNLPIAKEKPSVK